MSIIFRKFFLNFTDNSQEFRLNRVIESKNGDFPVGAHVFGLFGWRTLTVFNPKNTEGQMIKPYVLPPFDDLPLSLGLGYWRFL